MRVLMTGFGLGVLMVALMGLSGCGTDNETTAQQLQQAQGAPPATDAKPGNAPPPAKDMSEYISQQQKNSNPLKSEYGKAMRRR
jgi:hypothetical protein